MTSEERRAAWEDARYDENLGVVRARGLLNEVLDELEVAEARAATAASDFAQQREALRVKAEFWQEACEREDNRAVAALNQRDTLQAKVDAAQAVLDGFFNYSATARRDALRAALSDSPLGATP